MLSVLRRWLGLRERIHIPADAWAQTCDSIPLLAGLEANEHERLRGLAEGFLSTKRIECVDASLELAERHYYALAAQACLPVLNLGLDWYAGFVSIVVYPDEFFPTREYVDEAGVVHVVREELAGEAWLQGPVILSWADIVDPPHGGGFNLVVHEFAHKLDMRNGAANGMPPLHRGMDRRRWTEAFTAAYEDLCQRVDRDEPTDIDPYATTDPAEFFAVLSEYFFDAPGLVQDHYPRVYALLAEFYRQDPASRLNAALKPGPRAADN